MLVFIFCVNLYPFVYIALHKRCFVCLGTFCFCLGLSWSTLLHSDVFPFIAALIESISSILHYLVIPHLFLDFRYINVMSNMYSLLTVSVSVYLCLSLSLCALNLSGLVSVLNASLFRCDACSDWNAWTQEKCVHTMMYRSDI